MSTAVCSCAFLESRTRQLKVVCAFKAERGMSTAVCSCAFLESRTRQLKVVRYEYCCV